MKNDKMTPVTSVTEGYKHAVLAFISAIDNKSKTYKAKHYNQLLTGINEFFTAWTSFGTLSLSDCIDKIVVEFIPIDFYSGLSKDQKRAVLRGVLTSSIKEFSKIVIKEFLEHIIDNHKEPANIEMLKERMVDLLIMEREKLYHRFLASTSGKTNETIDKGIAIRMQKEIKKLQKEKHILAKQNVELKKQCAARVKQVQQVVDKYKMLASRFKGMRDQNAMLKERLAEPSEYDYEPEPEPQSYPMQQQLHPSQVRHYNPPTNYVPPMGQSSMVASISSPHMSSPMVASPMVSGGHVTMDDVQDAVESEDETIEVAEMTIDQSDESDESDESPASTQTGKSNRAALPKKETAKAKRSRLATERRLAKAAAKEEALRELQRAEEERVILAKRQNSIDEAAKLADAIKTSQRNKMGAEPSISDVY